MKKLFCIIICYSLLVFTGCDMRNSPIPQKDDSLTTGSNAEQQLPPLKTEGQYLRINVSGETLGKDLEKHISADTSVTITANKTLPSQMPIYEITERIITEEEFQKLKEHVEVPEYTSRWLGWELDGNRVYGRFADYGTGVVTMSNEELETQARKVFSQISFLEGEYVYYGICGEETLEDSEGSCATRVMVAFCKVLDDARIIGNDRCYMWFNDSGLVEIAIDLFSYEQIGTMDMITIEEATNKIKTPDAFTINTASSGTNIANTLNVDHITLLLVNQQSRGCTILQPLYIFNGTATLQDDTQTEFSSEIIAIPESYTYEAE